MIIAVDMGKDSTKATMRDSNGNIQKLIFKTKSQVCSGEGLFNSKTYVLEHKGIRHLIGEDAFYSSYDTTKATMQHKLAMYLAISNLIGDRFAEVKIITGCPLSVFFNVEKREEYKQFLMEEKLINIKVNNENRRFNIVDILVLPESLGYVFNDIKKNENQIFGVIDIGGLNTNASLIKNLKIINSSAFTINEGGSILQGKVKRELNNVFSSNYQDYQIDYVIKDRSNKEINNIVDNVLSSHIDVIINEAKKYNWDVKNLKICFTGGGSIMLESQIHTKLPNASISDNAIFDNANGFLRIGEILNAKK
ncbi:MAG TPA: ParM/StbA family protein [Candidatus Paceibacterota bacterium]